MLLSFSESLFSSFFQLRSVIVKLITDPVNGKEDQHCTFYGLLRKTGIDSFYSLYHSGLVGAGAEVKEESARGLSELIVHCPPEALAPVAVKLTGPLVRAASERLTPTLKAAILNTLRQVHSFDLLNLGFILIY